MKNKFYILLGSLVLVFAIVFVLRFVIGGNEDTWICENGQWVKHGNPSGQQPINGCDNEKELVTEKIPDTLNLNEEETINKFFSLIDQKEASLATQMMVDEITSNESEKQAYAVQFNAIDSVKITSLDPFDQENWSENLKTYEINLDVKVNPNSADAVIPYYGWTNGENLRWITIEKSNETWKIKEIATGR